MDIILRYFVIFAAAIPAYQWVATQRKLRASDAGASPEQAALDRRVARTFYGSSIGFFLILGLLQWAGRYDDPLFPFYDRTTTLCSTAAWALVAILWTIHIVGVWRPGVAEAAVRLGIFRGRTLSAKTFRVIVTLGLLVNAIVFASLLAGVWGPIPRPKF